MNLCSEGYYKNRHSCFLIQYHLVLMTKYRHPVIQGELETRLKQYTMDYFKERNLPIQAMECMPDHIHILFDGKPNMNLAEFINAYKSASSRRMRAEYADTLKAYYWKPYFWSMSYFIGSVSDRTAAGVKQYINQQKE